MTDEQRAEISRLAEIAHDAGERVHGMGFQNTPTDAEEGRAWAVKYALAQADAYEARGRLQAAFAALSSSLNNEEQR